MTKVYRIAAECVIFNAATMGLYLPQKYGLSHMWNDLLTELFPDGVTIYGGSSPFLGGLHEIYRLMLRITSIFWEQSDFAEVEGEYHAIMSRLVSLDEMVPVYFGHSTTDLRGIFLYQGKHRLHICMLQLLLYLVTRPVANIDKNQVLVYTTRALSLLREYDLKEDNNPAICWPLIVLACVVSEEDDFRFTISEVDQIHAVIDAANRSRWSGIKERLLKRRYHPEDCSADVGYRTTLLDYLMSLNYPVPPKVPQIGPCHV